MEFQNSNNLLLEHFKKHIDLIKINYVHVFLSIEKQNEVGTWPFIEYCQAENCSIALSKSNMSAGSMEHFLYNDQTRLKENNWGIPEPINGESINEEHLDMVIVPLLAFDLSGHRVGYGKGFYDRFLSKCRKDCLKVGLSLFPPISDFIDANDNDVKMDYCISTQGLHTFGP